MRPVAIIAALIALAIGAWLNRNHAPAVVPSPEIARTAPVNPPVTTRTRITEPEAPPSVPRVSERLAAAVRSDEEAASVVEVLALIDAGGPFPHPKDGAVFSNRERALPGKPRGYYREYTVPTPGENDRGARRIVRGDEGETYYTRDHYRTFTRIN